MMLGVTLIVIAWATLSPNGLRGGGAPVSPLCMTCSPTWLADALSNVVLFLPLGMTLCGIGVGAVRALVLASLLSQGIEVVQFVSSPLGRAASVTDWCTNSLGALIGVLLFVHARALWRPTLLVAQRLWVGGVMTAFFVLTMSAWAVALGGPPAASAMTLRWSPLPHTPGYGWFGGVAERVVINGHLIAHRGTGPIMMSITRPDTLHIEMSARGRDEAVVTVPMMWLHSPDDAQAMVMLAQQDRDVVLRTQLRATDIGLATPELRHPNVFPSDRRDTLSLSSVIATIRDGYLIVQSDSVGRFASSSALSLSPTIGWALIQSVVGVDSPLAPWLSKLWIAMWFAPLGWWCAAALRSRGTSALAAMVSSVVVLAAVHLATRWWHVAPLGVTDWLIAIATSVSCALAYIAGSTAERSPRA